MRRGSQIAGIVSLLCFGVGAYLLIRGYRNKNQGYSGYNRNNNTNNNSSNNNMSNTNLPRGYRNNNPLNIRINIANNWQGKVTPNTDGAFEQFVSMAYGYRAAFVLIRNYINNGLNTISKIISKWAPQSENNTLAYIQQVTRLSGIASDTFLSANDYYSLSRIVYAMSIVENGNTPVPDQQAIQQGWNLI